MTDWAFYPDALVVAPSAFRVPEDLGKSVFCTDELVNMIRSSDLIGFEIQKVWTSDVGASDEPAVSFPGQFELPPDRREEAKLKRKAADKALRERLA